MNKIRVMIVEDSPVVSALLEYSIDRDPRLARSSTSNRPAEISAFA
jgi:hypothetical protein